jgi:hypothetical protein
MNGGDYRGQVKVILQTGKEDCWVLAQKSYPAGLEAGQLESIMRCLWIVRYHLTEHGAIEAPHQAAA